MLLFSLLEFLCCKLSEINSFILEVISQLDECWDSIGQSGRVTELDSIGPSKDIDAILDSNLFMEVDVIDVGITIACCLG
jgi:hypothetical protein